MFWCLASYRLQKLFFKKHEEIHRPSNTYLSLPFHAFSWMMPDAIEETGNQDPPLSIHSKKYLCVACYGIKNFNLVRELEPIRMEGNVMAEWAQPSFYSSSLGWLAASYLFRDPAIPTNGLLSGRRPC